MTPAEKTLLIRGDKALLEMSTPIETDTVLRIFGIRTDWREVPAGTIIGVDYTRINEDTTLMVKRRGEMTAIEGIMAVNKEFETGQRLTTAETIIRDILGGLYLEDTKATSEEIAHRKQLIAEDRAAAKAEKERVKAERERAKAAKSS